MTVVSRVVAMMLVILVALPGDMDALVSRAAPTPSLIVHWDGEPPSVCLTTAPQRSKLVSPHEVRSEFDEGDDLATDSGDLAFAAWIGSIDWPRPVVIQLPCEPLPVSFRHIPSWRLLGRYRC